MNFCATSSSCSTNVEKNMLSTYCQTWLVLLWIIKVYFVGRSVEQSYQAIKNSREAVALLKLILTVFIAWLWRCVFCNISELTLVDQRTDGCCSCSWNMNQEQRVCLWGGGEGTHCSNCSKYDARCGCFLCTVNYAVSYLTGKQCGCKTQANKPEHAPLILYILLVATLSRHPE